MSEFVNKSADGLTKNDHFRAMLRTAAERGFRPEFVLSGRWRATLENLKCIRPPGWSWLTRLECDRHVNPDRNGNRRVSRIDISEQFDIVFQFLDRLKNGINTTA